ncbi:CARDB domain-containing protein [Rivularia sp. PCC 7116]|uniref:CARDB domain-containing protein n=1 Tax=Rivularia sp. PCC 7116 TaxID=373994 RepID=UPI00029F2B05|nr:CARDB domain-containing protein [Rivularia sp. PCC 7116]AFY52925.1 CARDB domain-containing protein [Rivularia sp. PCC 7116]
MFKLSLKTLAIGTLIAASTITSTTAQVPLLKPVEKKIQVNPGINPTINPNIKFAFLPDLIIEKASIRLAANCRVNKPALYVNAIVKNIGRAKSPKRMDVGIVSARDASTGWGNGKGIPTLNPGAKTTVTFPIYYLKSKPQSMLGKHTFELTVNKGRFIKESNFKNNTYKAVSINVPAGHCNVQPPAKVKKINADLIARLIKGAVNGTELHLHNRGKKSGDSYHKKNASYIKLSNLLGGTKQAFNIPETKIDAGAYGWLRYYVNDINLSSFDIKRDGNRFKLSLFFESNGTELKGYHTARFVDFGDKGAPDIQMNNMRLDVYLTPTKDSRGRLTYGQVGVKFDAKIQAGGVCNFKTVNFCGSSYKRRIAKGIEDGVRAQLNNSTTRNKLAAAFAPQLNRFGIGKIVRVRIQGSYLVIEHQAR